MAGRIAGVLAGILLGVMVSPAMAQSLGDVAREESARRQQVKQSSKVFTNADLPASAVVGPPGSPSSEVAADAAEGAAAPADETATAGTPESGEAATPAQKEGESRAPAASTDDEAGWRSRADRVNAAVSAAHTQVRQLKALSDRLSLEAQASNPAIAAAAQAERATLRTQITQAEATHAAAQAERDAFVQQARVAGVPPAWIQ